MSTKPRTATHSPAGAAATGLILTLFRTNGLLLAAGDRLCRPLGLSSARWQVLGALAPGPATVAEAARRMGLRRQSVQRLVDALAADGLLELSPNPRHQRAMLVALSDKGQRLYARLDQLQVGWINGLCRGLGQRELMAATGVLQDFQQRLQAAEDAQADDSQGRAPLSA
jgi:DNA-binding MarR family transcriptional regulator